MHEGVDFGVATGSDVLASADGIVSHSAPQPGGGGYGEYIVIDHADGFQTLYGHNSGRFATQGQSVKQGQVIAKSGNTGSSTGPHCHFEIIKGGKAVNPAQYIKL